MSVPGDVMNACISLFSGAGIGDLGIHYGCGIDTIVAVEKVESRADLIRANYPGTEVIQGDITHKIAEIIEVSNSKLMGKRPLLVSLSPPCQGMSQNGLGKINKEIKKGNRPKYDPRNRLFIPALKIAKALQPEYIFFENVSNMKNTVIKSQSKKGYSKILDCIPRYLGTGYTIYTFDQEFADYRVPHFRKRLITIAKRTGSPSRLTELKPEWFNSGNKNERVSVKQAIHSIRILKKSNRLHMRTNMSDRHVKLLEGIPKNSARSAHYNECKKCKTKDTPKGVIYCVKCGDLLNRPRVEKKGKQPRAVKGYDTSYKRMPPNEPAKTLTQNSGVFSSDNKGHYCENRVLSLREILILSTVYDIPKSEGLFDGQSFDWNLEKPFDFSSQMPDKKSYMIQKSIIRQAIGESIPPLAMMRMIKSLTNDWPQ
jgi:DNA (cytosine-5)-methyltransferase 1